MSLAVEWVDDIPYVAAKPMCGCRDCFEATEQPFCSDCSTARCGLDDDCRRHDAYDCDLVAELTRARWGHD